jgi:hypothetical protein
MEIDYKISVFRNSHSIFELEADGDAIIELLRSFHAAGAILRDSEGDTSAAQPLPVKIRRCSFCDKPGHTVRTCPGNRPKRKAEKEHPWRRHKDKAATATSNASPLKRTLTEDQFIEAKAMHDEGNNSMVISRHFELSLVEVARIFNADNYEAYTNGQ